MVLQCLSTGWFNINSTAGDNRTFFDPEIKDEDTVCLQARHPEKDTASPRAVPRPGCAS